jgi:dipeptidyl aminopeptidase/acylaminoacyl peptidase
MVVQVHGGPSAAALPGFVFGGTVADLVNAGYFMFLPNPRGSYGQGDAFERLNYQDFGGGDLKDILAGIDFIESQSPVDDARLGVYGHSYGGFMTMWTVTHSQRFHAAVAGAGIANWGSYYGQNGIDKWMTPFFGATFYDDPSVYDRLSPIRTIKDAKTPTFIYVGERDLETPARPVDGVLAWPGRQWHADLAGHLSGRGPRHPPARTHRGSVEAHRRLVRPVSEAGALRPGPGQGNGAMARAVQAA